MSFIWDYFYRSAREDEEDPDKRDRRYFGFSAPQTEKRKLKNAEKRFGYSLEQLHSYPAIYEGTPALPDGMSKEEAHRDASSCKTYFDALDLCVTRSFEKSKTAMVYKHSRLQGCKPHWIRFTRCTNFRDGTILKAAARFERQRLMAMPDDEQRAAYLDDLKAKHRYLDYVAAREDDPQRALQHERERQHLEYRLRKLASAPVSSASSSNSPSPRSPV